MSDRKTKSPSPALSRQSSVGSVSRQSSVGSEAQSRTKRAPVLQAWGPAKQGAEVLELLGPFQDVLRATLGLRRRLNPGNPQQPHAKDVQLLQDSCATLALALSQFQRALGTPDTERPRHGTDAGTGGAATAPLSVCSDTTPEPVEVRVNEAEGTEEKLQSECIELRKEVSRFDVHTGRVTDLEQVAESLRSRVAELKAKENRTELLRCECRNLRVQIAELVAASVHSDSHANLEAEKADLQACFQMLSKPPQLCRGVALPKTESQQTALDGSTGSS